MAEERISRKARQELVDAVGERYRAGRRAEKVKVLDEFVAVTGYRRKHAIRLLSRSGAGGAARKPPHSRIYDNGVKTALVILWEASDRVCGKRLKPLVPILVSALERHGHLRLDEEVGAKVLRASAATIDRLVLAATRGAGGTARNADPGPRWGSGPRGDGGRSGGPLWRINGGKLCARLLAHRCVQRCVPLAVRSGALIVEAIERLRPALPFPLRAFDGNNGSEFINEALVGYCHEQGIELTRSRPHRKNDQAWIEQKNGSVGRRLVGYRRLWREW